MRFHRTDDLPAYVFATVLNEKAKAIAEGADVIDLGMGNPDGATPAPIVERLVAEARKPANHRYAPPRGIPDLRTAAVDWYRRLYGVLLPEEKQLIVTMGAKDAVAHLSIASWGPGDAVIVPDPTYPLHAFSVRFAGARQVPVLVGPGIDYAAGVEKALREDPGITGIVASFPHNPTTAMATQEDLARLVTLARERRILLLHDFAYCHFDFSRDHAPSALSVPGAMECCVEIVSFSKSYNMAGYRIAFAAGWADGVQALTRIKSYLDYGSFAPVQAAAATALREGEPFAREIRETYRRRAAVLVEALAAAGWKVDMPAGTMFLWAKMPEAFRSMGSLPFALHVLEKGSVSISPGIGFGAAGEGFVRFALIEDEPRTREACRRIGEVLRAGLP
jgi:alanine-synthesizing transaminase